MPTPANPWNRNPSNVMPKQEGFTVGLIELAETMGISGTMLRNLELDLRPDMYTRDTLLRLKTYVAGNTQTLESIVEVPETWWDGAKECMRRSMPTLCRQMQVSYRCINTSVTHTNICPHLDIPVQDRRHLRFVTFND